MKVWFRSLYLLLFISALLVPAAATIRRLEMIWQPLYLGSSEVEVEPQLYRVPVNTYYANPEVSFGAIDQPYFAPVTDPVEASEDINLVSLYGIEVFGTYGESKDELVVRIDASEAHVPSNSYPFTVAQVIAWARECAARTFGERNANEFETLKIVVVEPGEEPGEPEEVEGVLDLVAELEEQQGQEADEREVIEVGSVSELLDALGSDRIIEIGPGNYNLSKAAGIEVENGRWEEVYDGVQLVLSHYQNLTLRGSGEGEQRPSLLVEPRYADTLNFTDSVGIEIEGLTLGHTPEQGTCTGSVLEFNRCRTIELTNLNLFGCGMDGLHLEAVVDLVAERVHIHSCSYGVGVAMTSRDLVFRDCVFANNGEFYGFDFSEDLLGVAFEDCLFLNNQFEEGDSFFGRIPAEELNLKGCSWQDSAP